MRDTDPTADIEMPRIGRSLPKTLSEDEVDALLNAPNTDEPLGHRDRAMLELLYATGLRVSELINLKQSQVNFNQGVLRIVGKGDRERLIPLGEESQRWLKDFINGPRMEILLERQTDYLFPTRRGDRMTRQAFWHIIKRYAEKAGVRQKDVAAQPAPCICDAPSESRCRPAGCANVAGTQRSVDDTDLHACSSRTAKRSARRASSARLSRFDLTAASDRLRAALRNRLRNIGSNRRNFVLQELSAMRRTTLLSCSILAISPMQWARLRGR